jgi:hypothetical protein
MTHPITPPLELVQQWGHSANLSGVPHNDEHWAYEQHVATQAARWGADQELEACCEWLDKGFGDVGNFPATLRAARRPKPPTLKEQALEAQQRLMTGACRAEDWQLIGRAIEALPDD